MRPVLLRLGGVGLFVLAVAGIEGVTGIARAEDGGSRDAALVLDLGGVAIETRRVPHGVFTQGSPGNEVGHDKTEGPRRQVTISKDFWIGKYPVTRGQFAKFVADARYVTDAEKGQAGGWGWDGKQLAQRKDFNWRHPGFEQTDEHPVVLVTFGDANAFVAWASRKTAKRVRLPTEAEWELAARAGTTTPWYGASTEADALELGWFKTNAGTGTHPVGRKKPNAFGIFDMTGGVLEWCRDHHGPYRKLAVVDPDATNLVVNAPERRAMRGGSWFRSPKRGRSAARSKSSPGGRRADNGFRVVVTDEETVGPDLTQPATAFAPASPLGAPGSTATTAISPGATPAVQEASGRRAGGARGPEGGAHLAPSNAGAGGSSWALLLGSPLAAASAVVAWMLLRRKRPRPTSATSATPRASGLPRPSLAGRPSSASLAGVSTREAVDGFYVTVPNAPPGSRVRYAGTVNGIEVTDFVPLDGGNETFVFTGSPPTGIRVLQVSAGTSGGYRTAERHPGSSPPPGASAPPSKPSKPPPPVPAAPPASESIEILEIEGESEPALIEAMEIVSTTEASPIEAATSAPPAAPPSEPKAPEPAKSEPKAAVPEPAKSEPKAPEPAKSEPKVPEPAKSEPKAAVPEPAKSEPKAAVPEPTKSEPKVPEPAKSEPKAAVPASEPKVQPAKSEPKAAVPASEPKAPEPAKSEPKAEPAKSEPPPPASAPEPAKSEPKAEPAKSEPEPAKSEPKVPEPAKSEPKAEPAKSEPPPPASAPEPAKSEPPPASAPEPAKSEPPPASAPEPAKSEPPPDAAPAKTPSDAPPSKP